MTQASRSTLYGQNLCKCNLWSLVL